jgi:membrane-bound serine protease (ClpP class)
MDILLNPNIAYLTSVLTLLAILAAIVAPGTGLIEIAALFLLGLSAYMIYNIGMNLWALIVLLLSVVPFFIAIRSKNSLVYLVISIVMLIGGSLFLFTSAGGAPSVNPLVAIVISALAATFIWFAAKKSIQAQNAKKHHDIELLIGETGEARTDIHQEGSILIGSELWSARSQETIHAGDRARVVKRDGFVLIVEPESKIES